MARSKQWAADNPERARENSRRAQERVTPEQRRARKLRVQYGLTIEQAAALCASGCAICGTTERRLVIDHCHTSGKVRAALCNPCNLILGLAEDNAVRLRHAAQYLRSHENRVGNRPTGM